MKRNISLFLIIALFFGMLTYTSPATAEDTWVTSYRSYIGSGDFDTEEVEGEYLADLNVDGTPELLEMRMGAGMGETVMHVKTDLAGYMVPCTNANGIYMGYLIQKISIQLYRKSSRFVWVIVVDCPQDSKGSDFVRKVFEVSMRNNVVTSIGRFEIRGTSSGGRLYYKDGKKVSKSSYSKSYKSFFGSMKSMNVSEIEGDPNAWYDDASSRVNAFNSMTSRYYAVMASAIPVSRVTANKKKITLNLGRSYKLNAAVTPSYALQRTITWASSNESVATVTAGVVTAVGYGTATITATAPSGKYTACTVSVPRPSAKSISVSGSVNTVRVGESIQLSASVKPLDASQSVTWSSSKTSVASVRSNGLVFGVKPGTTTITAKASNGKKGTYTVLVIAKPGLVITVSPATLSINVGESRTLQVGVTTEDASSLAVTWNSDNPTVAAVSSTGVVTAKAVGSAIITATDVGGAKASCKVTVSAPPPLAWSSWGAWQDNRESTSETKQEQTRVVYPYYYFQCERCGAHMHVYTSCYSWAGGCGYSSYIHSYDGVVVWDTTPFSAAGLKDWYGTGRYYTYLNGVLVFKYIDQSPKTQYRYRSLTTPVFATGINLSQSSASVAAGGSITLTANLSPSNATNTDVTWTSANTTIAKVSGGVVTGLAAGSTIITASTSNGYSAVCHVTVTSPAATTLTISGATQPAGTLTYGATFSVYGVISSNYPITSVTTGIYTAAGEATASVVTVNPNATSYNIHVIDASIRFAALATGSYVYRVSATANGMSKVLVESSFTVGSAPQTSTNKTITGKYKSSVGNKGLRYPVFTYEDAFFASASTNLNAKMAKASVTLAGIASGDDSGHTYTKKMLEEMGFKQGYKYDFPEATQSNCKTIGYSMAMKTVTLNGTTYNVYCILLAGTRGAEWYDDFDPGIGGSNTTLKIHEGFYTAATSLYSAIKPILAQNSANTNKVWIVGHSRGAAVANILAGWLSTDGKYANQSNVYCYTSACPAISNQPNTSLSNIYNYNNPGDMVTYMPLAKDKWGFDRNGIDKTLSTSLVSQMKDEFLAVTGVPYEGHTSQPPAVAAMGRWVPSYADYYNKGLWNFSPKDVFKNIAGIFYKTSKGLDCSAEWKDLLKQNVVLGIDGWTTEYYFAKDGYITKSFEHGHCQEAYIAWINAMYP